MPNELWLCTHTNNERREEKNLFWRHYELKNYACCSENIFLFCPTSFRQNKIPFVLCASIFRHPDDFDVFIHANNILSLIRYYGNHFIFINFITVILEKNSFSLGQTLSILHQTFYDTNSFRKQFVELPKYMTYILHKC
jgi:hypothetical protein